MLKRLGVGVRHVASLARNPSFAKVEASDLRVFESICGRNYVKTTDIDSYKTDWTKAFRGDPACVLLPSCAEEVSAILAHCARRRIAVVPQAGNTGLVGGSVPLYDEVVLSIRRINKHFEFDDVSGIMSCDAGMILEELDNRISPYG
ncbi:FAD-binding PCMH-type domain-containing protein [Trichostrongylus colubriformis]|uniref:FAD-binding PCMH-type domain-containing protein n=1 Tax=Trichostrongylus colubriformis TaxID=6319 RepID=A0AAN8G884_TRICO